MPITTSYPGVYVKEDNALSMSISSGSTAVPVFIFNPFLEAAGTSSKDFKFTPENGLIKIESWLDYLEKFNIWSKDYKTITEFSYKLIDFNPLVIEGGGDKDISPGELDNFIASAKEEFEKSNDLFALSQEEAYLQSLSLGYFSLQHYFENGGGPCYIYLYSKIASNAFENIKELRDDYLISTEVNFNNLPELISAHPDITLICLSASAELNKKAATVLAGLLTQSIGHSAPLMCLSGGDTLSEADYPKEFAAQNVAYYPFLKTNYKLSSVFFEDSTSDKKEGGLTNDENTQITSKNKAFAKNLINTVNTNVNLEDKSASEMIEKLNEFKAFIDNLAQEKTIVLSPVAAVAGAYCKTDSERGVWKAPANITLSGVTGLCDAQGKEVVVTESVNGTLLKNGINAIRYFPSTGFTIWGARTMVADTELTWRYIPVRRLFNIAERDIKEAMAKAVFEPNSPATWEILRSAVDAYLYNLWKQGALFGEKPEQAYFVKIGLGTTMTAEEINDGKMIIKVGMAAVRPAEFIILEFSQKQI